MQDSLLLLMLLMLLLLLLLHVSAIEAAATAWAKALLLFTVRHSPGMKPSTIPCTLAHVSSFPLAHDS